MSAARATVSLEHIARTVELTVAEGEAPPPIPDYGEGMAVEFFAGETVPWDLEITEDANGDPFDDFAGGRVVFSLVGYVAKDSALGQIALGGNTAYWELSPAELAAVPRGVKRPWTLYFTSALGQTTLLMFGTLKLNNPP